jgi:hypothetical protein
MSVEQEVEWLYAFDIHCNSFFPFFVLMYVVQFFLSPLIIGPDFLACLLANSLYAFAGGYYVYITFLGYSGKASALNITACSFEWDEYHDGNESPSS